MQIIGTLTHDGSGWHGPMDARTDSPRTLVIVFGAAAQLDDPTPIAALRAAMPQSVIIGASGAGVICGLDIADHALTAAVVRFERTELAVRSLAVDDITQSRACGRDLATALASTPGLSAVYVLADGLLVNGPELVFGLNAALPPAVTLAGGMAGDSIRFERTWTIVDGVPRQGHVTALGLYGDRIEMRRGCRGGSIGFGPRRLVTRAEGNVVYDLDGTPALRLYRKFLGDFASTLPGGASHFPLTVFRDAGSDEPLIRFVLGIDEAEQSITVAGDVPIGSRVQLSRANPGDLLQGSQRAAQDLALPPSHPAVLNLVVSCIGRRLVLGEQTDEELESALEGLPEGSLQTGFYSYGEISSVAERSCDMHNMTLTLTTVTER